MRACFAFCGLWGCCGGGVALGLWVFLLLLKMDGHAKQNLKVWVLVSVPLDKLGRTSSYLNVLFVS